jgi:hypothetical protein
MSWLTKGPLGQFWDKNIGREGLLGVGGELLGLGDSGTTADWKRRERGKLGSYIEGVEGREQPMREYYGGLQALQRKDYETRKKQMDYGASVEGSTIKQGYAEKRGRIGFADHYGMQAEEDKTLEASAFKYDSERGALDISSSMGLTRTGRAQTNELQGLSDLVYQLNEQMGVLG